MKDIYKNKNAIVLLGGTSLKKYIHHLKNLDKSNNIIFCEPNCISDNLKKFEIYPDYVICPFSVKLKNNYFQSIIYRSFLRKINIKHFIKKKYHLEVDELKKNFDEIFEIWRPHRGINKRYKYKIDVYLKNSPYSKLQLFPETKIILNQEDYYENFENEKIKNKIIKLKFEKKEEKLSVEEYFNINYFDNTFYLKESNFLNSQAICHFPILKFLGFEKIFFLGMDMNFFGNFSYDFREIFKSKYHLYLFLFVIRKTLNGNFKMNFPIYLRPKEEFDTLKSIIPEKNNFFRIIDNDKYTPVPKLNTLSINEFIEKLNLLK